MKRSQILLLSVWMGAACSGGDDDAAVEPSFSLPEGDCAEAITLSAEADAENRELSGVARYEVEVTDRIEVSLFGSDGTALGQVTTGFELDPLRDDAWTVRSRHERDGEIRAEQVNRFRNRPDGRLALETEQRIAGRRLVLWSVLGEDFELQELVVGVPAPGASGSDVLRTPDGAFRTLTVLTGPDDAIDEAAVAAFMSANDLEVLEASEDFQRLRVGSNGPGWGFPAEGAARLCEAAETRAKSSDAFRSSVAGLSCGEPGPFERVLQVRKVLAAAGSAVAITGSLVAAGVVTSGLAIGATLVVSGVAAYVVASAISDAVSANRRGIIQGLATGGNQVIRAGGGGQGTDAGQVADFFAGSGGARQAGSKGDPHFDTLDGLAYDFQGAGEFVLTRSEDGAFEVQARQVPTSGVCSHVALNTAAAVRLGEARFSYVPEREAPLFLNGQPLDLPPSGYLLEDGVAVQPISGGIAVRGSEGAGVLFRGTGARVDIDVFVSAGQRGRVAGLLGNADGDRSNDFERPDGSVLSAPYDWEAVHRDFGASWQVTPESSLFDYAAGEGPSDFVIAGFPSQPEVSEQISEGDLAMAEGVCADRGVPSGRPFEDCVLDVYCTGDVTMADAHVDREPAEEAPVTLPVFVQGFRSVSAGGPDGPGSWVPGPEGGSVVQENNGNPSFFVSDFDVFEQTVVANVRPGGGDNDFVGLAFGFRGPVESPASSFDTYLFSWKQAEEDAEGLTGGEGFTLSRIQGDIPGSAVLSAFWATEPSSAVSVLGRVQGPGTGWSGNTTHRIRLMFGAGGIRVDVDGDNIFDIPAAELAGPPVPGRVALYSFSQPGTTFSELTVRDGGYQPVDATCTIQPGDCDFGPAELPGAIDTPTKLCRGIDLCADYQSTNVTVTAPLEVAPGTVIESARFRRISVEGEGSLRAVGTPEAPVVFRAAGPDWSGIQIRNDSADNVFEHAQVRAGGGSAGGGSCLRVSPEGAVSIRNSVFADSNGDGIEIDLGGELTAFSQNVFSGNASSSLRLPLRNLTQLDGATAYRQSIAVTGGASERDGTWPAADAPFRFTLEGTIDSTIRVAPGARVSFMRFRQLNVAGSLTAVGTADRPIRFEASGPDFDGVFLEDGATGSFEHAVFSGGGGSAGGGANVTLRNGSAASFVSSRFVDGNGYGLRVQEGAELTAFRSNGFGGNASGSVELATRHLTQIDADTAYGQPLRVTGGASETPGTWPAADPLIEVGGNIEIDSDIVIQAGARFGFARFRSLVVNAGSLQAVGTPMAPIVLGPLGPDWNGLELASAGPHRLEHVEIRAGGGSTGGRENLRVGANAQVTLSNCRFVDGTGCGLTVAAESAQVTPADAAGLCQQNQFSGNTDPDLCLPDGRQDCP